MRDPRQPLDGTGPVIGADPAFFEWEEANDLQLLSREEEAELIQRAIPQGEPWAWEPKDWRSVDWEAVDWVALRTLLRRHMRLVFDALYQWRDDPWYEDLRQVGIEALLTSFVGFDPDRGVRFNTYAKPRIRALVSNAVEMLGLGIWNRELRAFMQAHKKARRGFMAKHHREPWYGELATELAALAANEIRAVWRSLWPEDGNVSAGLEAIAGGDRVEEVVRQLARSAYQGDDQPQALVESVEGLNRAIDCLSVLRAAAMGARHPIELDAEPETDGDADEPRESLTGHDLLARNGDTVTDQGKHEARIRFVASLIDSDPWLTSGQRDVLIGTLGLDGQGSRTPHDLAEELGRHPSAVAKSLERATRHIGERIEAAAGNGERLYAQLREEAFDPFKGIPDTYFNPFEDDPYGSEEEAGVGVFSDPFQHAATAYASGYLNRLSPDPDAWGAWDRAVEESIRWARALGTSFKPDMRGWRDPVAGNPLRSAPNFVRGSAPAGGRMVAGSWDDDNPIRVGSAIETANRRNKEAA